MSRIALPALAAVCFATASASAVSIPVGDFSFEDAPANGFDYNPNDPTPGQSAWDYAGGANSSGIVGQQFAFAEDTVSTDGSQLGFIQGGSSIAQNIIDPALVALNGQTLYLSFDAAGRITNPSDGEITVSISDTGGGNFQNVGTFVIPISEVSDNPALNGLRILSRYEASFTLPAFGDQFRIQFTQSVPGGGDVATLLDRVVLADEPFFFPGDANFDGVVNLLDFDVLAGNFGTNTTGGIADGDFNGDGVVDLLDFDILAGNFGNSQAAAVPEPTSLLALGVGALLLRRRRA
ncbi:MAG: dockerin type I domain-containing protein [Planctomycetota bacterium]